VGLTFKNKNMKIAVLGAGMVGRAIALDLAKRHIVSSFDVSQSNLKNLKSRNPEIEIEMSDLNNLDSYADLLNPFDLVVSAVPGFMGYETLRKVIECGKNVVDISFFPEDSSTLNDLAIKKGVTAITDCGVAPGMSNLFLGRCNEIFNKIEKFTFYVGGLPKIRKKPFEYKAPFSPIDVIEEYTRPARMRIGGVEISKPALSDPELMDFEKVGTLEAFNTDGLRSLLQSFPNIPDMTEKTLRYPGHIGIISALKESGFFNKEKILVGDHIISPLDVSSKILINEWKLGDEEEEFTVMKVIVEGVVSETPMTLEFSLYDEYNKETQTSSMARTTGYTCTAMVELILSNSLNEEPGVFPPEFIGKSEEGYDFVLKYLRERGVNWICSSKISIY